MAPPEPLKEVVAWGYRAPMNKGDSGCQQGQFGDGRDILLSQLGWESYWQVVDRDHKCC